MKSIEDYLGPQTSLKKQPVYRGWESGAHRIDQARQGDGTYTINYHQIRYNYPESLAEDLERFHVTDQESNKGSYPLVSKWYEGLSEADKKQVTRYSLEELKFI